MAPAWGMSNSEGNISKHTIQNIAIKLFHMKLEQEALLLQRDCVTCLLVQILQLKNITFENNCN